MGEQKNNWILLTVLIVLLVLSLITSFAIFSQPKIDQKQLAKDVSEGIKVPSAPTVDEDSIAEKVFTKLQSSNLSTAVSNEPVSAGSSADRLCELTNNCKKCFDFDYSDSELVQGKLADKDYRKLKQAVNEITDLEVKDYDYFDVELKDSYVYASTCKEGDKGNYEVQTLYRIDYNELDSHDDESKVVYVLVTSNVEDNLDVSVKSTEKVDRNFEISK